MASSVSTKKTVVTEKTEVTQQDTSPGCWENVKTKAYDGYHYYVDKTTKNVVGGDTVKGWLAFDTAEDASTLKKIGQVALMLLTLPILLPAALIGKTIIWLKGCCNSSTETSADETSTKKTEKVSKEVHLAKKTIEEQPGAKQNTSTVVDSKVEKRPGITRAATSASASASKIVKTSDGGTSEMEEEHIAQEKTVVDGKSAANPEASDTDNT